MNNLAALEKVVFNKQSMNYAKRINNEVGI